MAEFYKSHWAEIEDDRLARYERMFAFRGEQNALLDTLDLAPGARVLDFGCGPAFLTLEIARRVGPGGHAFGVDLNETFLARARTRASEAGLAAQVTFVRADGAPPLPPGSVTRVLCKNVLEYVPDLASTLRALYDVLLPGGRLLALDSDWGFVVVEPWSPEVIREFFAAAAGAFREPYIGRRLPGALARAGFTDIDVTISAFADRVGRGRLVLENMAGYVRTLGGMPEARVASLLAEVDRAIENGSFLFSLPQFTITARKA